MMSRPLMAIARMEFTAASRQWWIRLFMLAFCLITVAMAQAASVTGEAGDGETFARLTVALLPLVLMLAPLAALLVGVSSVSSNEEASGFLLALPVSSGEVILGRWLGQASALAVAIISGFGAGGALIWASSRSPDIANFAVLVGASVLLALAFLSIATLIASSVTNRGAALGLAAFVWFSAVMLYDAVALAAALWLTGRDGARVLFASVFMNVVDLVRVLTLTLAGTSHILGVAGESWARALGGPAPAAALAAAALAGWIVIPLAVAAWLSAAHDR